GEVANGEAHACVAPAAASVPTSPRRSASATTSPITSVPGAAAEASGMAAAPRSPRHPIQRQACGVAAPTTSAAGVAAGQPRALTAAPEDERIAALEAPHGPAAPRVLDHQAIEHVLRDGLPASALAHIEPARRRRQGAHLA